MSQAAKHPPQPVAGAPRPAEYSWPAGRPFLTAQWRHLVMLNFEIDPALAAPFVPLGTEIDLHDGAAFASVVAFRFLQTRVLGLPIPGHVDFDEVNLRLYVRRRGPEGWRRGVVFVRELVPRRAIAWVARTVYNENYAYAAMSHCIASRADEWAPPATLEYWWTWSRRESRVLMQPAAIAHELQPGSLDQFIAEHYWGYCRQRDGGTKEYQVAHPPWRVAPAEQFEFQANVAELYGSQFEAPLSRPPVSAFWADGSAVRVYPGQRI
ncbi:MAG: DUF2071 domain-containing protein [Planctomycetales bacterium]|nr:DUF2071 domain-containing protein [Planctomycetales bacterium]